LFGRARQLAALRDALIRAVAGEGGVLVVRGDPGIGKSALVGAALGTVDVTRFLGHAVPAGAVPGRAVAEIAVAAVAAGGRLDDPRMSLFGRPVEALIGTGPDPGAVPDPTAFGPFGAAVGEGLLRLLGLAADRPVAVFEDLHWADPDTRSIVEYLADHIHGRTAALVITHRTGESADTDAMTARIGRNSWSTVMDLTALPDAAVDEMTRERLPGGPVPSRLAADIQAFSEGVPLLVEEFLACALEDDTLRLVEGQWWYEPGRRPRPPASLRESVEVRVRRLGPVGRRLLIAGALLGRTFDAGLVTRALHLDRETVAHSVRIGDLGGLVRPGSEPDQVEFRHALIREAVDAMLVPPERTDLARSLLAALPAVDREPADSVLEVAADLALQAGRRDLAASCYWRAGRQAVTRGAAQAGTVLLEQAARLAEGTDLSVTARISLVEAHALTGHAESALRVGDSVLRQLDRDPATVARVDLSMARAAAAAQSWPTAQLHLDAAAGVAEPAAESALRAVVALGAGDRAAAVDHATRAAALADVSGQPAVACEAYEVLGRCARTHDLAAAQGWFDRAAGVADRYQLVLWRARALHERATISQLQTLELDDLHRARQAALDAGAPGLLAAVDFHIAAIHGVRFEPEPALAAARRCLDEARRVGVTRQQAWGWILIGQAHAAAGRRAQAGAAAEEAQRLAPGDPEVLGLATGTCRGLASLLSGDRDRTVDEFRAGIEQLRPLPRVPLPPWYLWPLIALVWTGTEGPAALAEADDPALRVAAGPEALWRRAAAVAAGRAGDAVAARTQLARAEHTFRALPGFDGYRHVGLRLAAEAAIADHWGDPGRWLTDAEMWSTRMGFDAFAASCRALQRRAGVRQRRRGRGGTPVPAGLAALGITTREADVLILVAAGMTNPQIADRLYISPRTVKSHLESLLRKTGCTGRTQLATLAAAHGLAQSGKLNR
jgi:DNA-binding CsgD family transcriptional regulator/tetratricopeptide (TPR) repeat protein